MTSSASSSEPVERENKPLISFIMLVCVVVGLFYVIRKYIGSIIALIVVYLAYVYRDDLKKEIGEVLPHDRP
jgi:hypothetical protein